MDSIKYVGIDLHQSTCLIAVHDAHGKRITEEIVETRAEALRDFFSDLTGKASILQLKLERNLAGCMTF